MNYYLLVNDDENHPNRWYLDDLLNFDNQILLNPPIEYMEPSRYDITLRSHGQPMDYTVAGRAQIPVVSQKFYDALKGLKEVDTPYYHVVFHPVEIIDYETDEQFYVMTIETNIDCVDYPNSTGTEITGHDRDHRGMSGQYRQVFDFSIKGDKIDSDIFRVASGLGAIIVSQNVKDRLGKVKVTGIVYHQLTVT